MKVITRLLVKGTLVLLLLFAMGLFLPGLSVPAHASAKGASTRSASTCDAPHACYPAWGSLPYTASPYTASPYTASPYTAASYTPVVVIVVVPVPVNHIVTLKVKHVQHVLKISAVRHKVAKVVHKAKIRRNHLHARRPVHRGHHPSNPNGSGSGLPGGPCNIPPGCGH